MALNSGYAFSNNQDNYKLKCMIFGKCRELSMFEEVIGYLAYLQYFNDIIINTKQNGNEEALSFNEPKDGKNLFKIKLDDTGREIVEKIICANTDCTKSSLKFCKHLKTNFIYLNYFRQT